MRIEGTQLDIDLSYSHSFETDGNIFNNVGSFDLTAIDKYGYRGEDSVTLSLHKEEATQLRDALNTFLEGLPENSGGETNQK